MDDDTVDRIIAMIDSRRERLDEAWKAMERGSRESGENLAATDALSELKWAILDEGLKTATREASRSEI